MDENLSKALSSFSITIFIIAALSLFFMMHGENSEIIDAVKNNMSERGTVYQAKNEPSEEKVLGAVIIGLINNGLETDISIDSVIIPKLTGITNFQYDMIDAAAMYTVEYVLNDSGEVAFVKYKKTGGE